MPGGAFTLTDAGALVQATFEPRLTSILELARLRHPLAAAPEPEGSLLVADDGPLATLYRLGGGAGGGGNHQGQGGAVQIQESFALRGAGDPPLRICGLARTATQIDILDANQGQVLQYDLHGKPAGVSALPNLQGRRPQGLYVDPATQHLWITTEGRRLEYDPAGGPPAPYPIPTTTPPTAVGAGRQGGELAILSARSNTITVMQPNAGSLTTLKRIQIQTTLLENPFQALSVVPGGGATADWRLLGSNPDAMILAGQDAPANALRTPWTIYE